jgi:NADH pyrophosphatase NudC (nudix superfamily)
VREAGEETGLSVKALKPIGDRVHPKTQRQMFYTACEVVDGEARVADDEELDAVAWVAHSEITDYVPYPLFGTGAGVPRRGAAALIRPRISVFRPFIRTPMFGCRK